VRNHTGCSGTAVAASISLVVADRVLSRDETRTTCVFHGPHAYISPTWYTERPAVPTWNYAVVHAIGTPTVIDDQRRLAEIIDETLGTFEPALRDAAADGYLPEAYRAPLLKAIVGFEMPIERLDGKFKLGQNRSAEDQAGIKVHIPETWVTL
jgi:transcriptional regulator